MKLKAPIELVIEPGPGASPAGRGATAGDLDRGRLEFVAPEVRGRQMIAVEFKDYILNRKDAKDL